MLGLEADSMRNVNKTYYFAVLSQSQRSNRMANIGSKSIGLGSFYRSLALSESRLPRPFWRLDLLSLRFWKITSSKKPVIFAHLGKI